MVQEKLNFGCGSIQPEGWINLDRENHGQAYIGGLDLFTANRFDIIVAHCSLQMNEYHDIPKVLKELYRVLKPNGILRISLPNIKRGFMEYKRGNIDFFPNGEPDIDTRFSAWLTWYSTTKTLLTKRALKIRLIEAGFDHVFEVDYRMSVMPLSSGIIDLDTRQDECYFIEARK